jgi:hypothetical protein
MSPWWTPDGRLAVIGRAAGIDPGQPATGPGDLFLVDLASGRNENVTRGRVPDLLRAFWSPRGDRAVLTARAWHGESGPLDARADLIALDPASGALVPLAEGIDAAASAWAPAWSPDGSEVAYLDGFSTVAFRGEGGAETRRVAVDGALSGALTWAPGGAAVLAVAADPGQPSRIIDLGSDPPTTVALRIDYDADWRAGVPQWGPVMPAPPVAPVGISGLGLDPAAPPSPRSRTAPWRRPEGDAAGCLARPLVASDGHPDRRRPRAILGPRSRVPARRLGVPSGTRLRPIRPDP